MIITYFGKQFFKIQQGDTVVALNPISKQSTWNGKIARFGSDIVLSSVNHPDYNGVETVTYGENIPVIINSPGDYEVKEIFIKGSMTRTTLDKKEYINTMYAIQMEGISIGMLGALTKIPGAEERASIDSPDILFLPLGGAFLSPSDAYKLAVSLEPSIIIPMEYDTASLKLFLKEAGVEKPETLDKLVIKKKDITGKQSEVIVLEQEH